MVSVSADKRRLIAEAWMEAIIHTYPAQSAASMLREKDPFRNPVGHTLREGVRVLTEELFDGMDSQRVMPALESMIQIRAVQDFSPREAVAFVFLLKVILREAPGMNREDLQTLEDRIDSLALSTFGLYVRCRERLHEVRMGEVKRKVGLLEKMYSQA